MRTNQIQEFLTNEWQDDKAYTAADLTALLGCSIPLAHYHLLKLVKQGKLCQIKHHGRTWYMKAQYATQFMKIGIDVRT